MEKKEYYKHILPHFQLPGQAYFVTWILKNAIPPHALKRYTEKLAQLQSEIERRSANKGAEVFNLRQESRLKTLSADEAGATPSNEIENLLKEYYSCRKKYIKAYDDLLVVSKTGIIDLSMPENRTIITETIQFWEGKRLETQAFCIMSNHVHWVFKLKDKDENGKPVYLQDIMHSVKRHSSNQINKLTGKKGALWQKESFDTTIRDEEHEYNAIKYTLNNPVAAKLVACWKEWPGNWCANACGSY
jgi:REP element-mobilizing transposase RayT